MSKPLQELIWTLKDGKKLLPYDYRYADFLIEGANNHIQDLKGRELIQEELDMFIYSCMDEYEKRGGFSVKLVNVLNYYLAPVGHQCQLHKVEKNIQLIYVAHFPHKPHPAMFSAYMFSNMVTRGWLEGLKRCKSPDCKKFFLGKSNRSWCSSACGSRTRVKKMRNKNKKDEI